MATTKAFSAGTDFPVLEADKLRVYSMRFCPYAHRSLLVLAHKNIPQDYFYTCESFYTLRNIPHEVVNVNLQNKPDWFLQRNPFGKVPVLEQDDKIVYESLICCDYLDQIYPENKLTPDDPYRLAQDRILVEHFDRLAGDFYKALQSPSPEVPAAMEKVRKQLSRFDAEIKRRGDYLGGDRVQMTDFMIWPWFERFFLVEKIHSQMIVSDGSLPNLLEWTERMLDCPSVKNCMLPMEQHVEFFQSYKTGAPNYDAGLEE